MYQCVPASEQEENIEFSTNIALKMYLLCCLMAFLDIFTFQTVTQAVISSRKHLKTHVTLFKGLDHPSLFFTVF